MLTSKKSACVDSAGLFSIFNAAWPFLKTLSIGKHPHATFIDNIFFEFQSFSSNDSKASLERSLWKQKVCKLTLQILHVYSTLKRRGNGRFHVVSTWNTRGVLAVFDWILDMLLITTPLAISLLFLSSLVPFWYTSKKYGRK